MTKELTKDMNLNHIWYHCMSTGPQGHLFHSFPKSTTCFASFANVVASLALYGVGGVHHHWVGASLADLNDLFPENHVYWFLSKAQRCHQLQKETVWSVGSLDYFLSGSALYHPFCQGVYEDLECARLSGLDPIGWRSSIGADVLNLSFWQRP